MTPESLEQPMNQTLVSPEEVVEPIPPAPAPEKLTQKQIGQLRRQWITQTNGTVKACGHKDNFSKTEKRNGKQPNNNCVHCWEAYFMTSVDLDFIHTVLTTKGGKALIAVQGTKFVRMFHGFLSSKMLPMLAAETDKAVASQITGGTFDRSGEVQSTVAAIQNIG